MCSEYIKQFNHIEHNCKCAGNTSTGSNRQPTPTPIPKCTQKQMNNMFLHEFRKSPF